jgi:FdhD protein
MYAVGEFLCFRDGELSRCRDRVAVEEDFELWLNGSKAASFTCTPSDLEDLVYGYLAERGYRPRSARITVSGNRLSVEAELEKVSFARSTVRFRAEHVLRAVEALAELGTGFKETGALHGALSFNEEGEVLFHVEDISRHCAVDKLIGRLVRSGGDPGRVGFALSCRLTRSIVEKLSSVGAPLVASKAAPTLQGIRLAEEAGVTLVGFARGRKFNVYAHPERILL